MKGPIFKWTGLKTPSGKGKHFIVSHFGYEDVFFDDASLIFQSKWTGDYHKEMNREVFLNHFRSMLPNLKDNAVIVLENAAYHSIRSLQQSLGINSN